MIRAIAAMLASLGVGAAVTISQAPSAAGGSSGICNDAGVCQGTLVFDAGQVARISFPTGANWDGTTVASNNVHASNTLSAGTNMCIQSTGNACVAEDGSGDLLLQPNGSGGTKLGSNSTVLTNIGVGSCTLSSGQCNAVVGGAQGSSLCVASVQGTSQTLVGCDARADAGSATAFCQATASGTAAIVCFN